MTPTTYLELRPISEKPDKDGTYWMLTDNYNQLYPNTYLEGRWHTQVVPIVAFYGSLAPVTGVLVNPDTLREKINTLCSDYDKGMNMQGAANNLIHSLTNKAKP